MYASFVVASDSVDCGPCIYYFKIPIIILKDTGLDMYLSTSKLLSISLVIRL